MRKVLYLLSVLVTVGSLSAQAQISYDCATQVAHNSSETLDGMTVTVQQSSPGPNSNTYCGAGPYQIGRTYSNWFQHNFSPGATHVRLRMTRIHATDTVRVYVNGVPYDMDPTNNGLVTETPYSGAPACNLTSSIVYTATPAMITNLNTASGPGEGVEYEITNSPGFINSIRVEHIRAADNITATDVFYELCAAREPCELPIIASVVQDPVCAGRDIDLTATQLQDPNTSYTWTSIAPVTPTVSGNTRNITINNIATSQSGLYEVRATVPGCPNDVVDTLTLTVDPRVTINNITQAGPKCPGQEDTIFTNPSLPIGGEVRAFPPGGGPIVSFHPTLYTYQIAPVTFADTGVYRIFAISTAGCSSDTINFRLKALKQEVANFTWNIKEGCKQDTVNFVNQSTGSFFTWDFGDNSTGSTDRDPTHYYTVPIPDPAPRLYNVELISDNGECKDTASKLVTINHPLRVLFTVDKDEVCQEELITFSDSSYAKPGTSPDFLWEFGDGQTDTTYNTTHSYKYTGIYNPKLTVTDYLGCTVSYSLPIAVDSAGGIDFDITRTEVCVGEEIVVEGIYSKIGYEAATWSFDDGKVVQDSFTLVHSYEQPGSYDITFDVEYRVCPDVGVSQTVTVKPIPQIYLGEDTTMCPGEQPIKLEDVLNTGNSQIQYVWNTQRAEKTREIFARAPGKYSVTAELDGCFASDTLEVKKDCYINIPNVFTPNGDGSGDYFLPRQLLSRSVSAFEMKIYNRWGELVFESDVVNGRGWDGMYGGEPQPVGVYIYQMSVTFENGNTERYQGNVTLLR